VLRYCEWLLVLRVADDGVAGWWGSGLERLALLGLFELSRFYS
jgi:hypothetical protein